MLLPNKEERLKNNTQTTNLLWFLLLNANSNTPMNITSFVFCRQKKERKPCTLFPFHAYNHPHFHIQHTKNPLLPSFFCCTRRRTRKFQGSNTRSSHLGVPLDSLLGGVISYEAHISFPSLAVASFPTLCGVVSIRTYFITFTLVYIISFFLTFTLVNHPCGILMSCVAKLALC